MRHSELSLATSLRRRRADSELTTTRSDGGAEEQKLVEQKATEDRIIVREHIQTGGVKLSSLVQYLKACRVHIFLGACVLFVLSNVFDIASNYWLSAWSDQSRDEQKSSKFYRIVVYFVLGFAKSKRFSDDSSYSCCWLFHVFRNDGVIRQYVVFQKYEKLFRPNYDCLSKPKIRLLSRRVFQLKGRES
jgi:hypothetical protein